MLLLVGHSLAICRWLIDHLRLLNNRIKDELIATSQDIIFNKLRRAQLQEHQDSGSDGEGGIGIGQRGSSSVHSNRNSNVNSNSNNTFIPISFDVLDLGCGK